MEAKSPLSAGVKVVNGLLGGLLEFAVNISAMVLCCMVDNGPVLGPSPGAYIDPIGPLYPNLRKSAGLYRSSKPISSIILERSHSPPAFFSRKRMILCSCNDFPFIKLMSYSFSASSASLEFFSFWSVDAIVTGEARSPLDLCFSTVTACDLSVPRFSTSASGSLFSKAGVFGSLSLSFPSESESFDNKKSF